MIGFYGYKNTTGVVNETCFSNFYPASFEYRGVMFPTSEHALMASKAKLFWDEYHYQMIVDADTPATAKAYGCKITNYNEDIWSEVRFTIMEDILIEKFAQNSELCQYLLLTGNENIVEFSPYDAIWGAGISKDQYKSRNYLTFPGSNLLGLALVRTRKRLQNRNS